jgi:hypothetical protein
MWLRPPELLLICSYFEFWAFPVKIDSASLSAKSTILWSSGITKPLVAAYRRRFRLARCGFELPSGEFDPYVPVG